MELGKGCIGLGRESSAACEYLACLHQRCTLLTCIYFVAIVISNDFS